MAWHSWRPPGREPFQPDGDIYNIWIAKSRDGVSWSEPWLALPGLSETKYATLAFAGGKYFLACFHRPSQRILLSTSPDGRAWSEPKKALDPQARFPSLAVRKNGALVMAYSLSGENDIWLTESADGETWTDARRVFLHEGQRVSKPKISVDSCDAVWISCQTDNWGSFTRRFAVSLESPGLELLLQTRGGGGNAVWTLNAVNIFRDGAPIRSLRFGSAPFSDEGITRITAQDIEAFDAPVQEILRELGSEVTRAMVYGRQPTRLKLDLPPADYEVEAISSSWVASRPGTEISFNVPSRELTQPPVAVDQSFFLRESRPSQCEIVAETSLSEDNNRPSSVCELSPGHHAVAWTSFANGRVQTVSQFLPSL